MYLTDAKLWADAYHESGHHKWVGTFLGCMYHGCPTCYNKQTFSTMLNKTMGDLYRETERWIKRVKTCGYMYFIMWECQWDKICKTCVEARAHVDSYFPVGHPRCLIGTNLRGLDVNSYEGLIKCKVLSARGYAFLYFPVTLTAS